LFFFLFLFLFDWTRGQKKTQLGKNCLRFFSFFIIYFIFLGQTTACSLRVQLPHALWPALMTLCHAWFNDRWITTLAPKLLSQIELASSHTHTHTIHTWIVIKRKVTEKYRGKMALFFPVVKSRWGGDLMWVWVFRFVPHTTFGYLILFYWPGQKVLDPTSTRNIIIRVYNLSACNPCVCVCVSTSLFCPLILFLPNKRRKLSYENEEAKEGQDLFLMWYNKESYTSYLFCLFLVFFLFMTSLPDRDKMLIWFILFGFLYLCVFLGFFFGF
jgi:hypothetical protein